MKAVAQSKTYMVRRLVARRPSEILVEESLAITVAKAGAAWSAFAKHDGTSAAWLLHEKYERGDANMLAIWLADLFLDDQIGHLGWYSANHRQWGSRHVVGAAFKQFVSRSRWFDLDVPRNESETVTCMATGRPSGELGEGSARSGGGPSSWWKEAAFPASSSTKNSRAFEGLTHSLLTQVARRPWGQGEDGGRPVVSSNLWMARALRSRNTKVLATKDLAVDTIDMPHLPELAAYCEMLTRCGRGDLSTWLGSGQSRKHLPVGERRAARWIYVLREVEGDRVKVGKTDDPNWKRRVQQHIASSSQGRQLDLVCLVKVPDEDETLSFESAIHRRLRTWLVPGKKEWFFAAGDVAKIIESRGRALADWMGAQLFGPDGCAA